MSVKASSLIIAIFNSAIGFSAAGQTLVAPTNSGAVSAVDLASPTLDTTAPVSFAVEQLLGFKSSEIKFDLNDLIETLRDRRHEGWVLAAYPDPKTAQPLIGAGVSLDLPAREHPQLDPLNPHAFIEPSSAEIWQAAGLDAKRLQSILANYHAELEAWSKKGFRKRIKALMPQISDDEATQLLRVSAIQAAYNAKGYCRHFDEWSPSQQMALSQLVYQMGYNLQEFSQFLNLINHSAEQRVADAAYWKMVQQSLIQSQWARLYRIRAVAVIAMLDPAYVDGPGSAEHRVGAMLHPAVLHRRAGRRGGARELASVTGPSRKGLPRHGAKVRRKQTA